MRLIDALNELHDHYARQINEAVERDDLDGAEALAHAYETDAVQLMAEREGLTRLLPLAPFGTRESSLRRVVRRLRSAVAA